jgi:hypothetical protein
MTLPGFTAGNSVYRTSGHYRTSCVHDPINGTVYPAQLGKSRSISYTQTLKTVCKPGTSCVPDRYDLSCSICTYRDEACDKIISWRDCDPIRASCFPLTFCNPDPLNPFCEICTDIDETCRETTHQYCIGVEIPNKIPVRF